MYTYIHHCTVSMHNNAICDNTLQHIPGRWRARLSITYASVRVCAIAYRHYMPMYILFIYIYENIHKISTSELFCVPP
jgi:hypothetical protein